MLVEVTRDFRVGRVREQRHIGGQHGRLLLLVGVVGVGHGVGARVPFGFPLVRAAGALGEFPLKFEQVVEEPVGPLRGRGGPGNLEAAGDRVAGDAGLVGAAPAEALVFNRRAFGLVGEVGTRAGAVGLAEGVAARDQRNRLFVVHGHAAEGDTDVFGRTCGVWLALGAFRVHIDEAHGGGAVRVGQIALPGVALVGAHPGSFGAEVDIVIGLPGVWSAAGEAEGLEAHRLQRDVAGQNHQVGPGYFLAVLLLHLPQQPAGAVEVDIVRPAVERSEALLTASAATTAVVRAVGAG